MTKSKINIAIGFLTGLLIGFVFGAAFGTPGKWEDGGRAAGNAFTLLRHQNAQSLDEPAEASEQKDSLVLSAVDDNGDIWTISLNKK